VVDVKASLACALALASVLALACGRDPLPPEGVVALYFRSLPRDPTRAFLLLGPEVHRAHGLRVPLARALQAEPGESPFRLSSAQVGWLDIFKDPWLRTEAGALRVEVEDVSTQGDAATVRTTVDHPGQPPFEQVFELRRRSGWQIVAITQDHVDPANETAAFAAAPTTTGLRRLLARRAGAARRGDEPGHEVP
jgi:hypothetical protein